MPRIRLSSPHRILLLVVALHAFLVRGAAGATVSAPAVLVALPRAAAPPLVDCRLDDAVWNEAAVLTAFVEIHPGDNTPARVATEVRLAVTSQALHVAIEADEAPDRIRAGIGRRDALDDDDVVSLYLDTFRDRRRAYVLTVNPLGMQQDGMHVEGQPLDRSVDLVFASKGCLTPTGYAVELTVPFASLSFGPGAWGLHVIRQRRVADEELSWMPVRRERVGVDRSRLDEVRARLLTQAGTLTGFERIDAARRLDLIPSTTAAVRPIVAGAPVDGRDLDGGLTAHVRLTPALGVDVAVVPDFAEIEADQLQLTANTRFPLFYEEKRPFFLEGAERLQTPMRIFHSRAVVEPDVAVKLAGQHGRTSAGVLVALDAAPGRLSEAERTHPALLHLEGQHALVAAARIRRDVGQQASLGLLGTSWQFGDRANAAGAVDGRMALGARTVWTFQLAGSSARLPFVDAASGETRVRHGGGAGYFSDLAWSGDRGTVQLVGEGYTPDYRAEAGYTQRRDTNRWALTTRFNATPRPGRRLVSWSVLNTALAQFDWRGRMQAAYTYPRARLVFLRQTSLTLSGYADYVRLFEEEFGRRRAPGTAGAFVGDGERSTPYYGGTVAVRSAPLRTLVISAAFDRTWRQMDLDLGAGPRYPRVSPAALRDPEAPLDPGPGSSSYVAASATWRPRESLSIGLTHERSRLVRDDTGGLAYDQRLWSLRVQQALSRFTWLRLRLDADSVSTRLASQLLFGWTPSPGSSIYAGVDGLDDELPSSPGRGLGGLRRPLSRTIFVKASWRLRQGFGDGPAPRRAAGDEPE